ncbi:UNVERIFIED_CONTAM: hypothetical protein K2H54_012318 [Gekko kuhli]
MMKVVCDQCHGNFCLKHRHPLDHDCAGAGRPLSKAGHAAMGRAQKSTKASACAVSGSGAKRSVASPPTPSRASEMARASQPPRLSPPAVALQNGLSEEEALQQALEMSLAETVSTQPQSRSTQEEEDLALAQALSASEEEYQRQQQQQQQQQQQVSELRLPLGLAPPILGTLSEYWWGRCCGNMTAHGSKLEAVQLLSLLSAKERLLA